MSSRVDPAAPASQSGPWRASSVDYYHGRRWAALIAALAMALTMVPYLTGFALANGRQFMWLGYNLDDSCVYLSWMRQAADGGLKALNLFTTSPQHGLAPNPLFWFLGRFAAFTHLPLVAVYHGSRILSGFALLLTVWELIRALIVPRTAQRLAFLFVCFSAGLGWLPVWRDGAQLAPIDMWQPESITFLSLYLSPLFCFAMMLQVAMVHLLLIGERTGNIRYSICAGICGFLLGLTHTYDVITMTAVWLAYLSISTILRARRGSQMIELAAPWVRGVTAGIITLPAVAYIAYQLASETVFRERANVATLTPALSWILLGYGGLLPLAILGGRIAWRSTGGTRGDLRAETQPFLERPWSPGRDAALLLISWAIVNVACAYIPTAFQRKLLQGSHIPIAMLAGIGAAWILGRLNSNPLLGRFPVYAAVMTLLLCPSNLRFMRRDIDNFGQDLAQTKLHRTYLRFGEVAALHWIRANTPPGTAVQPLPWIGLKADEIDGARQIYPRDATLMCFTPGLINRPVYCGHWGETPGFFGKPPDFAGKLAELTLFATKRRTDAQRIELLRAMRVQYIVFSQKQAADTSYQEAEDADEAAPMFRGRLPVPDYLKLRHSNADADVYQVLVRPGE